MSCKNLPIINLSTGFEYPLNIKIVEVLFEFRHIQKAYFAFSSWIGKKLFNSGQFPFMCKSLFHTNPCTLSTNVIYLTEHKQIKEDI